MKRGRRFKTAGSLIVAAIGATAVSFWLEEEFAGPNPEKPRLSDPDSDALYTAALDDETRAARTQPIDTVKAIDEERPAHSRIAGDGTTRTSSVEPAQSAPDEIEAPPPQPLRVPSTTTALAPRMGPVFSSVTLAARSTRQAAGSEPATSSGNPDPYPPGAALPVPSSPGEAGPASLARAAHSDALAVEQPGNPGEIPALAPPTSVAAPTLAVAPGGVSAPQADPAVGTTSEAPSEPQTGAPELLALAPIANGTESGTIVAVERLGDGGFRMRAADLRALRVMLDPAIGDDDSVAISSLPGIKAQYVEATQSLALEIPNSLLAPTFVDARGGRTPVDVTRIATVSGLLINYRLFGTAQGGDGRFVQLTGDTEVVGMTRLGLFVTNGSFATNGRRALVRGDSFFRFEDPARVRTYTVGDFASGAVSFSRSVRLGGIQVQSDFQQRPDLFTGPLPQFAGTAALPSALDLYIDNRKVFSSNVPQGPFILRSLPQISGNELRIVTTDASGRQTEITTPYFNAPGLLNKGLFEYSAELGAPRINAGLRSFDYRSQLFGSATVRYGLGDRLTVEGHLEAGGDLANGGIGLIRALGPLGSITASANGSNFRGRQGARLSGQYRFDQKRFSLFANIEREYGNYLDLGDISSFRGRVTDPTGADLFARRARRSVERIGASLRPAFDPVSINLAYNHVRLGNSEIRTANVGLRRRLTDRISFRGDALFDLTRRGDLAVSAGLDIRLGRNTNAFAGADRTNGRTSYNVSATGFNNGRQNAFGYAIAQRGNDDGEAFRSASVNYRLPQAFVAASINQSGRDVQGVFQVEGAVVAAGRGVFVANRVGEGFAIVKNAGPGVDILQSGRKIARSNSKGRALLSSLEAFSETRVAIDPTSLPAGLEAENGTDFRVLTARRRAALVDFGVRKVNAAIVIIRGPDGKPIPPGTRVDPGSGEPGFMGYDGEVFLKDLKARNNVLIDLGPAGKCSATFDYDLDGGPQPVIGPLTCL